MVLGVQLVLAPFGRHVPAIRSQHRQSMLQRLLDKTAGDTR